MKIKIPDDTLRLPTRGRLYKLFASISKSMAEDVLRDVHESLGSTDPLIARRKVPVRGKVATVDYTIVQYDEEPSFLKGSRLRELRYGLVLLVQYDGYACVLTAGKPSLPDAAIGSVARRVAADAVADVEDGDKIQSYSSRSMSLSRGAIRSRTLVADDLGTSVPTVTLNRQVLTAIKTTRGGAARTARISTAYVSTSSPRATLRDFVEWFVGEVEKVQKSTAKASASNSAFVNSFARRIKREDLPGGVQPTAVFVDLSTLEQGIADGELALFLKDKRPGAPPTPIPDDLALSAIRIFGEPGTVEPHSLSAGSAAVSFEGVASKLTLHMNKQSYSLSSSQLRNVRIGSRDGSVLRTIPEWLRDPENEALFVSMSDIRFAFALGTLVQDEHIAAQADMLLTCLHPVPALAACASEKGESALTQQSTTFPADSVFGTIEAHIAAEPILVCDDLGDEWADYIGIDESKKALTLYHAKHGPATTSASAFQTVVGQAVKNLGRLGADRTALATKKPGWRDVYRTEHVETGIARIRKGGTVDDAVQAYERVAALPTQARVALVASFLSKAEIEQSFARVKRQGTMRRQDPQRVWLLSSFVSLCREAGREALIYCAP